MYTPRPTISQGAMRAGKSEFFSNEMASGLPSRVDLKAAASGGITNKCEYWVLTYFKLTNVTHVKPKGH